MVRDVNQDGEFAEDELFFFGKDHLNSVHTLTDKSGKPVQRYSYTAYGETKVEKTNPSSKLIKNFYAYTSREWEEETGDYYYRARYYDPGTGRFLALDPIGFAAGDANLYRYVGNSPASLGNPFGLDYTICNRPLKLLPGSEELMSRDPSISHTYLKFDDGTTISYGPEGEIKDETSCTRAGGGRSNKSQEDKMKEWAKRNYNKDYSLLNYNCKDFAVEALLNGF